MWQPAIGVVEIGILLLVAGALLVVPRGARWMAGILPCFVVGAVVTPADPVSMLLVALPLAAAFLAGVRLSPFIQRVAP